MPFVLYNPSVMAMCYILFHPVFNDDDVVVMFVVVFGCPLCFFVWVFSLRLLGVIVCGCVFVDFVGLVCFLYSLFVFFSPCIQ
jgi:hypothetical protein